MKSFEVGEYYHIFNRGNDHRDIFMTQNDYDRFLVLLYVSNSTQKVTMFRSVKATLYEWFSFDRKETLVDIGAYCLMPNHFHLLVREKTEKGTSRFMQKLMTSYMMYFNRKEQRTGSLFGGSFKSVHVMEDRHLKHLFSYIHLNPHDLMTYISKSDNDRRDELVEFLKNYLYSSNPEYFGQSRIESKILNKSVFPPYFASGDKFEEEMRSHLIKSSAIISE